MSSSGDVVCGDSSVGLAVFALRLPFGPSDACALARAPKDMLLREAWTSSSPLSLSSPSSLSSSSSKPTGPSCSDYCGSQNIVMKARK